jgi:hypothetical protein
METEIKAALISVIPATLVAIAALALSIRQALSESRKSALADSRAQRELFEKFNERFNALNEDLNAIREGQFSAYGRKTAQGVIQDYLNLCSEEYLWKKRGLIDDEIWEVWLDGINHYLQSPPIAEVFYREWRDAPNSYYGLFQHARLLLPKATGTNVIAAI